jgi:CDP-diacylglycerol--serine O-phosphatidyltransferase
MARNPTRWRERRRRLRVDSINRLLPNALTMLGLCAGLTAIRYGLQDKWHVGIAMIAVAALLDTLDGRMARLMGGPTEFGGQLDSLVDAISFGVAPMLLVYLWSLQTAGGVSWVISLLFVVCCVLRLARFNITSADPDLPAWAGSYFSGVPAPAGAGMVLLPMLISTEIEWDFLRSAWLNGPWMLVVAALMISRTPTYSFKRLRVQQRTVRFAMVCVAAAAAAMIVEPWYTLSAVVIAYTFTIPFSIRSYARQARVAMDKNGEDVDDDGNSNDGEPE